jgi:hypothetical protein
VNTTRAIAKARSAPLDRGWDKDSPHGSYLRHCVAACEECKVVGPSLARLGGKANEALEDVGDWFRSTPKNTDDEADLAANETGIACCLAGHDCVQCCDAALAIGWAFANYWGYGQAYVLGGNQ